MSNKPLKLPKQLSFAFMRDIETEKRASLSKEEHSELIQALAELIIICAKEESLIKTMEIHNEH
jgi:hypothetical protein